MLRITITLIAVLVSAVILKASFSPNISTATSGLLMNLGTEIIGIALTVAIVEWLFERRRDAEEARRMAWQILHRIDHAIWVWKGGSREFNFDELQFLVYGIKDSDPLPPFTQTLLLRIGSGAAATIQHKNDLVRSNKYLLKAFNKSSQLAKLRDEENQYIPTMISEDIKSAVFSFAQVVGLSGTDTAFLAKEENLKYYNSSIEAQEWRHFGRSRNNPSSMILEGNMSALVE